MKKRGPKAYSEEFRREAVRLTESRPITQIARELGIHPETLRGWRRVARARGDVTETAGGGGTVPSLEEENRRLVEEREILERNHKHASTIWPDWRAEHTPGSPRRAARLILDVRHFRDRCVSSYTRETDLAILQDDATGERDWPVDSAARHLTARCLCVWRLKHDGPQVGEAK